MQNSKSDGCPAASGSGRTTKASQHGEARRPEQGITQKIATLHIVKFKAELRESAGDQFLRPGEYPVKSLPVKD